MGRALPCVASPLQSPCSPAAVLGGLGRASLFWASFLSRTPGTGTFWDSMTCAAGSCWSPVPERIGWGLYEGVLPDSWSSLAEAAAEKEG